MGADPLLIIAALATVIASQAVISGVFSLTRQAVRLGYLSPMRIIHTSEMESGQIYIPFVNWMLYVAVVIVIVSFEHSSNGGGVRDCGDRNHGADVYSLDYRGTSELALE
ncbi:hypothetical protein DMI62_08300 [Escherichia coli]|nr:hypothetical protein [Escherichia coli]